MNESGRIRGGSQVRLDVRYLDRPWGKLLLTSFLPQDHYCGEMGVLLLPPAAEELNKSRRMLALQARQLANNGISCFIPDVMGTGDSDGSFADGAWLLWKDDVRAVTEWIRRRHVNLRGVVAARTGVFLLPAVVDAIPSNSKIALWAPVAKGRKWIDQLLRSNLFRSGAEGQSVASLRNVLTESGCLEVAGYRLGRAFVEETDTLDIGNLQPPSQSGLKWFDVSTIPGRSMRASIEKIVFDWRAIGVIVDYSSISGRPFWLGPEIEIVPELLSTTTEFFVAGH